MIKTALLLFMALIISAGSAFAAPDAKTIIAKLYCPSGQMPVADAVIELEEMVSQGDTGKMDLASRDKIYFQKTCKIRVEAVISDPGGQLDGRQMTIIRDGKYAMQYLSTGQFPVKKRRDEPSAPLNIPFGLVSYPQEASDSYTVDGSENIDGVQALKIRISGGNGEKTVWIDTKRCVPLKLELTSQSGKKSVKKTVSYKDIGVTKDGRYFPMKIEVYVDSSLSKLIVYKGLVVNSGIDSSLFKPMDKILK